MSKYTHRTHLHGCLIQWRGPRGPVEATSPDGKRSKQWESNPDGKALGEAIAWCRAGCEEVKIYSEPETVPEITNTEHED